MLSRDLLRLDSATTKLRSILCHFCRYDYDYDYEIIEILILRLKRTGEGRDSLRLDSAIRPNLGETNDYDYDYDYEILIFRLKRTGEGPHIRPAIQYIINPVRFNNKKERGAWRVSGLLRTITKFLVLALCPDFGHSWDLLIT